MTIGYCPESKGEILLSASRPHLEFVSSSRIPSLMQRCWSMHCCPLLYGCSKRHYLSNATHWIFCAARPKPFSTGHAPVFLVLQKRPCLSACLLGVGCYGLVCVILWIPGQMPEEKWCHQSWRCMPGPASSVIVYRDWHSSSRCLGWWTFLVRPLHVPENNKSISVNINIYTNS